MSADQGERYRNILNKALEASEAQRGCIVVLNAKSGLYDIVAAHDWQELVAEDQHAFKKVIQKVFAENTPITTTNINQLEPTFGGVEDFLKVYSIRSILCVPFRIKKDWGAVYVDIRIRIKGSLFSDEDVKRMQMLLNRYH